MSETEAFGTTRTQQMIVAEAVDRMFKGLESVAPLMPIAPITLVLAMWARVNQLALLIWGAIAILMPLLRIFIVYRYRRRQAPIADAPRWANLLVWNALVDGLLWGSAGVFFFVADSVPHQGFLLAILVGISASSIFITSYWPPVLYALAVPGIGITALRLASEGTHASLVIAVIAIIYLFILHKMVQQANGATMDAIRLRFENNDLIDELREQKKLAEQANLAKSKFLAAASHDLRQPLHALGLFVAALRDRIHGEEVESLVENIRRSVAALDGLFNALLDISKLDAGIVEPRLKSIRLGDLFNRLAIDYAPQAQAKGLAWRNDGEDVIVYTDPALLESMLRNLISNAIRYTEYGEIAITWGHAGDKAYVSVEDTGIGIAPEYQQAIFQEFYQLHNPERDRNKGLGLGLAIVKRVSTLLDYKLELQSESSVGTKVTLLLPLGEAAMLTSVPDASEDDITAEATGILVLVIDDESSVLEAMAILLGDWGYQVVTAASLEEAQVACNVAPDIIIADYRLRGEYTGADAIRQIQQRWHRNIPALIMTGDTSPERLRQARDSSFAFLHKPVQPSRLRAFLRHAANLQAQKAS